MFPIAFSPCPNDTFLFYAWVTGKIGKSPPPQAYLTDIESLNALALQQQFPLLKVSIACYKKIRAHYTLIPFGAALGYGVGPKIVARQPRSLTSDQTIAIPGKESTAHALFSHFYPHPHKKLFCTYDKVLHHVKNGQAELGVIIHETRFTFQAEGFHEVADLGTLWEEKYQLPLPLGCLVAHKSLSISKIKEITSILEDSLAYAYNHPEEALEWVLQHAQEKDLEIVKKHIALYLTPERISPEGERAIEHYLSL